MGTFTLGISFGDFDRLPDVPRLDATGLLREFLLRLKPIPLDPRQLAAWQELSDPG